MTKESKNQKFTTIVTKDDTKFKPTFTNLVKQTLLESNRSISSIQSIINY